MRKLVFVVTTCSVLALAQDAGSPTGLPFVRATGDCVIDAKPDQATVDIGVVNQATTAAAAAAENANRVSAVINRIKKEIGSAGEVRTVNYSINPNYSYPNPPSDSGPKILGYSASNTVEAKVSDIALVGKVLDAAIAAGANNINGVRFSVKDERPVRTQALRQAALNARSAAEAMAAALGVRVVRVHSAETGEPVVIRPVREMAVHQMMAADIRAPTPVEPGNVQVRATVTVTLEVAQ
jgi:uncharacterized protein YggE